MKIMMHERFLSFLKEPLESMGHTVSTEDKDGILWIGYPSQFEGVDFYPNLKYIQTLSAGFDELNLEDLKQRNITLSNAKGAYSESIAEYVIGHVLSVYKNAWTYMTHQKHKTWEKNTMVKELRNKKVFYLGTGSIGSETAKRFKVFGTTNIGFNSNGRKIDHFDVTYPLSTLNTHLKDADIVVASLPSNETTTHLITSTEVNLMKPGSVLVNVGRGSLIDEASVKDHIDHLQALILDVFEVEPLNEKSYLWHRDNVIITPHISGQSEFSDENLKTLVLKNVNHIMSETPLENLIKL